MPKKTPTPKKSPAAVEILPEEPRPAPADIYERLRKPAAEKQQKRVTFISDRIWNALVARATAEKVPIAQIIRRALIRELGLTGISEDA